MPRSNLFSLKPGQSVLLYRLRRLWRRRVLRRRLVSVVSIACLLIAGGIAAKELNFIAGFQAWMTQTKDRIVYRSEFTLKTLDVSGRQRASLEDITFAILGENTQVSSLRFDPIEVRTRIEALDWVRTAEVSIVHPDIIRVRLEEFIPAAVWYDGEALWVLDPGGVKIVETPLRGRWANIPLVVGAEAPNALNAFLNSMARASFLEEHLKASVWTSKRRWVLVLKNGIHIDMPERQFNTALNVLHEKNKTTGLLKKAIQRIDLRNVKEPVIRLQPSDTDTDIETP